MKFEEMKKHVPSDKVYKKKYEELRKELSEATSKEDAIKVVKKYHKLKDNLTSDSTIISIRHTIDTTNKEYDKANNKCDEVLPVVASYEALFIKDLVSSKYRKDLEDKFTPYYFELLEAFLKSFDDRLVPFMVEDAKLSNEYEKIFATGVVEFKGESLSLTQLAKYLSDNDRSVREEAAKLYYGYIEEHDKEIGEIYDKLVHLRDKMAKTLGFERFTELAYLNLSRLDYTPSDVSKYREQIHEVVVPEVTKLRKRQAKRLGIKKPDFLDYSLKFKSGNPKPIGNSEYLVEKAKEMYNDMSKESGEFFNFMVDNHLMDLDAKKGKRGGGYMTYIPKYKSPFIFANSNGTAQDVDTLTHEVGHAFQGYLGSKISVPAFRMPTLEACEIDSMSMEFFAYPYMESFFGKEADKYRYTHLDEAISFLPYGVEVDEFQHWVYDNVDATHEERCAKWAELEKKYRPHLNFDCIPYLNKGKFWMRQSHIFVAPFYYIDYTLAQVLALQFKCEMDKNREKAWKKYIKLLKMGGKYPFVTLIKNAKLRNPFEEGNVKKVIKPQMKVLLSIDDTKF